jgi:hypothetical protein
MSVDNEEFTITPVRESAKKLAETLLALIKAKSDLNTAIENVPEYTGQWDNEHFYNDEMDEYNKACNNYEVAVRLSVMSPSE